jgi:hypothetical protein
MSDPNLFGAGLYAKSFIGKQKGKLVWQTVRNGNPFSGNPITNSTFFTSATPAFTDLTLTGKELKDRIAKQTPTKATYIRARVKYDPTTAITGQVYGPWRYPEGFLRGRRDIGSVALPVKFISFVALKQNADVLLKWITTDETPGINYQVEHSVDGIHFSVIGTVMGFNNSQNEYQWLHTTPVDGKNYYRIRAVENGKDAFSVIRQVNFSSSIHATVYPNPVKSGAPFTVELTNSPGPGSMNIELFTIHGQKKAEYIIAAGNNTIHITLPELPAGQYILKVINENRLMYSGSLIVVK